MISIDHYAYMNRLKQIHPMEKFALSMGTLVICMFFKTWLLHFSVIAFMSFLILYYAKIPFKAYFKLMLVPLAFLSVGVLGIAVTITRNPSLLTYGFKVGNWMIGVEKQGFDQAVLTFSRAYASVTCLYFLALTTPMVDVIWILKQMRVPRILTEMMTIIYRFIFVLLETASMMYLSQECRLGYASISKSYHSLGQLVSNLFIKSFQRSQELFTALSTRGYTGSLEVLEEEYVYCSKNIRFIIIAEIFFIGLAILL
ncbi:cobalt ECF transporter T component CbiQ [Geosporobacter ferrireducens]|uniref:Cobalt ECF transporter T component CbiQ n=1 Tax=Geosporobacter ferrireducens TaxID=1424294 RepID=A0A1D8GDY2_9FIRM|nr:cobalt ECF transporter T component CbiQ [Geosporobacter ferrireducens]AOT69113.1 cobalt ECF transporter T component CbiQ [Geosporobacter ferrireducens]MTI56789.1 cobalt ECF transporter T component CbiQ [Geosporobacter ferrireducens]